MGPGKIEIGRKLWLFHGDLHGEKERGNGVYVHGKCQRDQDNRGDVGQEDSAGRNGQRRQVHVIATVRKDAVPLEHGHNAGDDHGEGEKKILVRKRGGVWIEALVAAKIAEQAGILVEQKDRNKRSGSGQQRQHGACAQFKAAFATAGKQTHAKMGHQPPIRTFQQAHPALMNCRARCGNHGAAITSTMSCAICSASCSCTRCETESSSVAKPVMRLSSLTEPYAATFPLLRISRWEHSFSTT